MVRVPVSPISIPILGIYAPPIKGRRGEVEWNPPSGPPLPPEVPFRQGTAPCSDQNLELACVKRRFRAGNGRTEGPVGAVHGGRAIGPGARDGTYSTAEDLQPGLLGGGLGRQDGWLGLMLSAPQLFHVRPRELQRFTGAHSAACPSSEVAKKSPSPSLRERSGVRVKVRSIDHGGESRMLPHSNALPRWGREKKNSQAFS